MFEITYKGLFIFITLAWVATRVICGIRNQKVDWKYEGKLLPILETVCILSIIPMGHQILSDGFQGMMFTALMLEFLRYSKDCQP